MGIIFNLTCKNKICRAHWTLFEGEGMVTGYMIHRLNDRVKNGEVVNAEAMRCIKEGGRLHLGAIYLCTNCKELTSEDKAIHGFVNVTVSPYGTVRKDVVFPFGKPHCRKCGRELIYIDNARSSKVKCPKCGGDLKVGGMGVFD